MGLEELLQVAKDWEYLRRLPACLMRKHADVRINRYRSESILTREQQVQQVERSQSFGLGVRVLAGAWKTGARPPLWDGLAAVRIVHVFEEWLAARPAPGCVVRHAA
jgi:hypothetical protein